MEKIIVYYRLLLKDICKKKTTWFSVGTMIFLVLLILGIRIPTQNNTKVGMVPGKSENAGQIYELLRDESGVFDVQTYENEENMKADIASGKLVCGFCVAEDLDRRMEKGKVKDSVKYITGPMEVKGEVAKETFYSAFLVAYSDELIRQKETEIYGTKDPERLARIQEEMDRLLTEEEVFQIKQEYVQTAQTPMIPNAAETYPVQGTVGILILIFMFVSAEKGRWSVFNKVLYPGEKLVFDYIWQLTSAVPVAVTGLFCILFSGQSRGVSAEVFWLLVLIVYGGMWNMILAGMIKNETGFVSAILVRVILMVLICPVFVDFSQFVPALQYIRSIFPLGIYL